MLMPPKKSTAARTSNPSDDKHGGLAGTDTDNVQSETAKGRNDGNQPDENDTDVKVDYFDPVIIDSKRKRSTPQAEKALHEWLSKHFVAKDDVFRSIGDMHSAYLDTCTSVLASGVEIPLFMKVVNELFPKGMDLAENSPYAETIRKRKKKRIRTSDSQRKQSGFRLTSSDIRQAFIDLGNPSKGIHFNAIRRCIRERIPNAQLEQHPNIVKNALIRDVYYGKLECLKGVGACGVYRLPRTAEEARKELEEENRIKKEKELKEANEKLKDEGVDGKAEKDGKTRDEVDGETKGNATSEAKKAVKKKAMKKKPTHHKHHKLIKKYGKPKQVEDLFPLAMTYNSEPKQASSRKIIKYLQQYYHRGEDIDDKVKKWLESGAKTGYWEQVVGISPLNGTFCLTIEAFDPTADDDFIGQIMNAIVACTEPKVSSARLLKQYVTDYHPEFRLTEKPKLFKRALQRALDKKLIVQVSGLGATGSFQLAETFTPSPSLLQGKDVTDDDPESEESDANEDAVDASLYHDAYVPRPTSRGRGRKLAAVVQRFDPSLPNPEAKHLVSRMRKKLSESVSARRASGVKDERHKAEAKKRGPSSSSNKRSPPTKKIKKLYTEDVSESDSEQSDDSNLEVYTPRKTKSRGGVVSLPPPKRQIDKQRKTVDRRNKVVVPAAKSTSTSKSSNRRVSLQLAKVAVDRRQKPSAKKPEKPIKSKLAVKRLSGGMKPRISSRIASVKKRRG